MRRPLVSIIVTIYNKQDYIRECVNSLIAQTYNNLQIILVDDGSNDNSPQICDELAALDCRIMVLHQENEGMCPARNAGLDMVKGEWICILDGDDYVDKRYIELLLDAAITNDTLIAQCAYKETLLYETDTRQIPYECSVLDITGLVIHNHYDHSFNNISLCDKIYHKSLFDTIRFPDIKNGMDVKTICELLFTAKDKGFAVVNQVLFFYRQTPGSMSRAKRSLFTFDEWKHAYVDSSDFFKDKGLLQVYSVFFIYAYNASIRLAMECMRDIPQHSDKIYEMTEYIKNHIDEAIYAGCDGLTIRYGSAKVWDLITAGEQIVLYGYGRRGRDVIYPWFKYFNIAIKEIWDMRANEGDMIDGIPLCRPSGKLHRDTRIIITILDETIAAEAETQLRGLGYINFLHNRIIYDAIKYAALKEFMPFLLEENV